MRRKRKKKDAKKNVHAKAKAKAKKGGRGGRDGGGGAPNPNAKLHKEAADVKKRMSLALSQSAQILQSIDEDLDWDWANTEKTISNITVKRKEVEGGLDQFGKVFALLTLGELRKKYTEDNITAGLHKFVEIKAKIEVLEKGIKSMLNMQKAR